jgi:uncharacterized protein YndB with AHSA1/START domain
MCRSRMFGTAREREDGRVEPRFERRFAHSRDKVWRALTSTAVDPGWHEGLEKLGRALDL